MIPGIQRILYATDLSSNSAYAFRYAINFAILHNATITILHVFEVISVTARSQLEFYLDGKQRKEIFYDRVAFTLDRMEKRLKVFCEKELRDDPKSSDRVESIEVCEGFSAAEILEKADELKCDAIVMGTHGKVIIANTFLGSTTKRVLRRTRKPVFIVPLPKGETDITFHDA